MIKMRQGIDIFIISERRNFLHNFKLSYPAVFIFLISILMVISTTFLLSYYNIQRTYIASESSNLKQENVSLLNHLDSLNFLVQYYHTRFDNNITKDNMERTYLQINYVHPDVWSMGIGGHKPNFPQDGISNNVAKVLDEIYESIDILKGKYQLRKTSINEILLRAEKNQYLWSHIPSTNPVPGGRLGSGFGYRVDPIDKKTIKMHEGIDIGAPRGTPIYASADGVVSYIGWNRGYGLMVDIDHSYGFRSRYAHCSTLLVKPGDPVKRGQVIALVGATGRTTAPHLHYEVHVLGVKVNPIKYIDLSSVVVD